VREELQLTAEEEKGLGRLPSHVLEPTGLQGGIQCVPFFLIPPLETRLRYCLPGAFMGSQHSQSGRERPSSRAASAPQYLTPHGQLPPHRCTGGV
jgi:hypothetical protein